MTVEMTSSIFSNTNNNDNNSSKPWYVFFYKLFFLKLPRYFKNQSFLSANVFFFLFMKYKESTSLSSSMYR